MASSDRSKPANISAHPDDHMSSSDGSVSDDDMYVDASDQIPIQGLHQHISEIKTKDPVDSEQQSSGRLAGDFTDAIPHTNASVPADIVERVKGMYRVLDLVSERGSGGLVDKIIISQQSLGCFINDLSQGAYASLTNVDFRALDDHSLRPVGLYGSKSEIISFLISINAIDQATAIELLKPSDDASDSKTPCLRSGLYLLRPTEAAATSVVYVIYWPEETTWNDDAISSVERNRTTFMRYLTKLADQTFCLISSEHANSLVWQDEAADDTEPFENDETDRIFDFKVDKTTEQEENIMVRPGFSISERRISHGGWAENMPVRREQLRLRLLCGDAAFGFLNVQYVPSQRQTHHAEKMVTKIRLRDILNRESLELHPGLSLDSIKLLIDHGLEKRIPEQCMKFKRDLEEIAAVATVRSAEKEREALQQIHHDDDLLNSVILNTILAHVSERLPIMRDDPGLLGIFPTPPQPSDVSSPFDARAYLQNLCALFPEANAALAKAYEDDLLPLTSAQYRQLKEKLVGIHLLIVQQPQLQHSAGWEELVKDVLVSGNIQRLAKELVPEGEQHREASANRWPSWNLNLNLRDYFLAATQDFDLPRYSSGINDAQALADFQRLVDMEPLAASSGLKILEIARDSLRTKIASKVQSLASRIRSAQESECKRHIARDIDGISTQQEQQARSEFLEAIRGRLIHEGPRVTVITNLTYPRTSYHTRDMLSLATALEERTPPLLKYTANVFGLSQSDNHALQLNSSFMPMPMLHRQASSEFSLPADHNIIFLHLLADRRCLVVVDNNQSSIMIYLEYLHMLNGAIQRSHFKRFLDRKKLGSHVLLCYDETKRSLAVFADSSSERRLYIYVFDERYVALQLQGAKIDLGPYYDAPTLITHVVFVPGNEEIALIETSGRARVFSLVTQQFRPAFLMLPRAPSVAYSTPDGSCLLVQYGHETPSFVAYHWATFGSQENSGISLSLPEGFIGNFAVSCLLPGAHVHLIAFNTEIGRCTSLALDITQKVTEFMFRQKGQIHAKEGQVNRSAHNSLMDCHNDVWIRFPVSPAIHRRTITSTMDRLPRSLSFVTDRDHSRYQPYMTNLMAAFERATRKPTGRELKDLLVGSMKLETFSTTSTNSLSTFHAGEWLVDLLCLIPIHIAVTRDNRFIPLKDGVWSAELEASLLGASVEQITDSITFGWYESVFHSYMATMPVKVVSSMGEQSVGKSFALNHLADTSFAGSAMRTTEGVWMSATPTDDALIVTLDFEGVHSIERSAQEDTLLVLFNTAISNLVLFRNNFAFSRDITGLFHSFQASSSILDPRSNPDLFQSKLLIIIKDVVESDKTEIVREFSLKFQDIVRQEQSSNFISRLHAGDLSIIPWPVIESKQFYNLFNHVKRQLDAQTTSHHGARIFLQTIKTLMAKLKANDWGAMSHNLAAHRARLLESMLPRAIELGAYDVDPIREPLRNFDTNVPVDVTDSECKFTLESSLREDTLSALRESLHLSHNRQRQADDEWLTQLVNHLDQLTDQRLAHVKEWLSTNTARFSSSETHMEDLRRTFDLLCNELKASVRLCGLKCTSCHLLCLGVRYHTGDHLCRTSHRCIHLCEFKNEHEVADPCGLPAGHTGRHVCDIKTHLCGQPCRLDDKRGCLKLCSKVVDHDGDDHLCESNSHECGEPCNLRNVKGSDGTGLYNCPERCHLPSEVAHDVHLCENRSCPLDCQICSRMCSSKDHLHALEDNVRHLCGQQHACKALCIAPGICHIETTPQQVEATFNGRHEAFQYTKYSQVAKRLTCQVPIPANATTHTGAHQHNIASDAFHFCQTRCEDCGYYCTLPYGHSQTQHETNHGSMTRTQWTLESSDGVALEIEGHKFGQSDEGAPMLCSMVCRSMGRHVHIDFCRAADSSCTAEGVQHISTSLMHPEPDRPKDWINHALYWRRTGFKDPYSQEERTNFSKCDYMCAATEHGATTTAAAQPSFCTLPMFHAPLDQAQGPPGNVGYISGDGHHFSCRNPAILHASFHVIFVIDRSSSMTNTDRSPLQGLPVTGRITAKANNRLGAVYSSLYSFWLARQGAVTNQAGAPANRRDAYSAILFDRSASTIVSNDFTSDADALLNTVLAHSAGRGTNYTAALVETQAQLERGWSTERSTVVIFLSDGESSRADIAVRDLCRRAVALGKALSFHAVSFGRDSNLLRRMVHIAKEVQDGAPADPLLPLVPCSFATAIDTIQLAETFLGIETSMRKQRGSLMRR